MLVHCFICLSARVEFKFEFEFNRLSGVEIEIERSGVRKKPKPSQTSPTTQPARPTPSLLAQTLAPAQPATSSSSHPRGPSNSPGPASRSPASRALPRPGSPRVRLTGNGPPVSVVFSPFLPSSPRRTPLLRPTPAPLARPCSVYHSNPADQPVSLRTPSF